MSQTEPKTHPITTDQSKRRQLLLGTGATLLLAACGGGGGGESKAKSLREVYDRIEPGMHNEDVTELAGFGPYATGEDTWWNVNDEFLRTQIYVIGDVGPDPYRIRKVFYWTSTFSTGKELP